MTDIQQSIIGLASEHGGDQAEVGLLHPRVTDYEHDLPTLTIGEPEMDGCATITPSDMVEVWVQGDSVAARTIPGAYIWALRALADHLDRTAP